MNAAEDGAGAGGCSEQPSMEQSALLGGEGSGQTASGWGSGILSLWQATLAHQELLETVHSGRQGWADRSKKRDRHTSTFPACTLQAALRGTGTLRGTGLD